mmetsp:Transcript_20700/g.59354  ORF Transcript_20700/g.59354 Transcript_20700/m.59354 type:complete len:251 (-) Transcript_20700:46-798(-)
MRSHVLSVLLLCVAAVPSFAFTPITPTATSHANANIVLRAISADGENDEDEWTNLTEDGAVKIRTVSPTPDADAPSPTSGEQVSVDYVGTVAPRAWSAQDVVDAWLSEQQGLDALAPKLFIEFGIDGDKLVDDTFFTEQFVTTALAVDNKIKCKKLCMAARNIKKGTYDVGLEFDSSKKLGKPFTFPLGKGKAIKAFELAIPTMRVGDTAQIVARCDYAYGKEGLRRTTGEVVVPPYATLCFDVTLLDEN